VPSGTGLEEYANGDTYEGQYVNGMKHGSGVFTRKKDNCKLMREYKFDKLHGISKETHPNGTDVTCVLKDGNENAVNCHQYRNGDFSFAAMCDGRFHGTSLGYFAMHDHIVVYTYEAGEKQGKGKKYTYKEQVD
jgi:antitoxin component YwqK of YwqJK toxin-antitoxin module